MFGLIVNSNQCEYKNMRYYYKMSRKREKLHNLFMEYTQK